MTEDRPYVAVDAGSTFTKAYLLEDVEGERRLVAVGRVPTLGDDGHPAPEAATERAVSQALATAGIADASAAQPRVVQRSVVPRVLVIAPREDQASDVLAQLERLPLRLLEPVLLGMGGAGSSAPERLLGAVEAQVPDAVVLAAGADPRGADGRAAHAALEALRFSGAPPFVVIVGNEGFKAAAATLLEGVHHAVAAPGDEAALASALAPLLEGAALDGIRVATEMLAERYDVDVLTLDLGAAHALAVLASGTTGRRKVVCAARDDLGLRRGRPTILAAAGAESVLRWLPVDVDEEALLADARRGLIAPAAVPETTEELLLEHAFAREALRLLLAELPRGVVGGTGKLHGGAEWDAGVRRARAEGGAGMPPVDLLVGSGGALASAPRLMQAALILLDAVQPEALTQLALDRATALPLLGYLGASQGHTSVGAALERDGLLNLGLCVAPIGNGREGESAIRVEVAYALRSPVTVEVPFGAIEVVPLAIGERAALKLWPSRDFDVGLGRGNAATPRAEVEGGAVGIIIDARGRPLALPGNTEKRQAKLLQWLQGTRAYPQLSFVHPESVAAEVS